MAQCDTGLGPLSQRDLAANSEAAAVEAIALELAIQTRSDARNLRPEAVVTHVVSDAVLSEKIVRTEAELKKAAAEVVDLRTALQAAKDKEMGLKDDLRKSKGRVETNNRVYLVTKGEVELLKERIAQAERLLWKAGIVVPKPEAKERPKATGPLAADRPRVEKAEEAASVESAPAEAEGGAEKLETAAAVGGLLVAQVSTEAAMAIATGPQASPPMRRKGKSDELKN